MVTLILYVKPSSCTHKLLLENRSRKYLQLIVNKNITKKKITHYNKTNTIATTLKQRNSDQKGKTKILT